MSRVILHMSTVVYKNEHLYALGVLKSLPTVKPQSTTRLWPFTCLASSDARKTAAFATSS
uniref:Uncharacterized protein n=1 Tax=Oryza brachyantha TaxID=4533 RepID=J3MNU7_ORYBR